VRIANVDGRCKLLVDGGQVDLEKASRGRFGPTLGEAYERFGELRGWAESISSADEVWQADAAGPPAPTPRQVFAVALNYVDHAAESGLAAPDAPVIFTKFPTSLSGPVTDVVLPKGSVDWEVELVAVIGQTARSVSRSVAWDYVAGLTAGQDLSERELQLKGPAPQFSLAKSFQGFSPTGPSLVTPDELDSPEDLELGCELNGEQVQKARTSEMIFTIPQIIEHLSRIVTLLPGDVIFTGTPPGVGLGRTPPRFLCEGDRLGSWVEGIGNLTQTFVAGTDR
jgi:2,4-didehydro-3-deoxy-L-rhamnonate hydrolase